MRTDRIAIEIFVVERAERLEGGLFERSGDWELSATSTRMETTKSASWLSRAEIKSAIGVASLNAQSRLQLELEL